MTIKADHTLDCFGLLCPMPVIKTSEIIKKLKMGEILEIIATDKGIKEDIPAWCRQTGQECLKMEEKDGVYKIYIKKVKE
ncbi:MAG: sulfurtransferase TusA family protein [Acidobacteriota bacterium]